MTVDERLEFLLQSTESLHAAMQEQYGKTTELTGKTTELSAHLREQSALIDKHTEQLRIDADNIRALARIAEAHERRLDKLAGEV